MTHTNAMSDVGGPIGRKMIVLPSRAMRNASRQRAAVLAPEAEEDWGMKKKVPPTLLATSLPSVDDYSSRSSPTKLVVPSP